VDFGRGIESALSLWNNSGIEGKLVWRERNPKKTAMPKKHRGGWKAKESVPSPINAQRPNQRLAGSREFLLSTTALESGNGGRARGGGRKK